jgi:hypothetical protein
MSLESEALEIQENVRNSIRFGTPLNHFQMKQVLGFLYDVKTHLEDLFDEVNSWEAGEEQDALIGEGGILESLDGLEANTVRDG